MTNKEKATELTVAPPIPKKTAEEEAIEQLRKDLQKAESELANKQLAELKGKINGKYFTIQVDKEAEKTQQMVYIKVFEAISTESAQASIIDARIVDKKLVGLVSDNNISIKVSALTREITEEEYYTAVDDILKKFNKMYEESKK